jgi:hypothetical protein
MGEHLTEIRNTLKNAVVDGIDFLGRQPRDWTVTAIRSSTFRLFYQRFFFQFNITGIVAFKMAAS